MMQGLCLGSFSAFLELTVVYIKKFKKRSRSKGAGIFELFWKISYAYLRDLLPCRMVAMAMMQSVLRSVLASPRWVMLWFT